MAYYFAVEANDRYLVKDIKKSGYFDNNYKYKQNCACTLEEIDEYTSRFRDEEFLKRCLVSERIIKEEEKESPILIINIDGFLNKNGAMGRKVYGSILTKKSRELLYNTKDIVKYIEDRITERDLLFFYELGKIIPNDTALKPIISKIDYAVKSLICDGSFETVGIDFLNEILLVDKETNYEAYHNMISFIADYEEYLSKNKENNKVKTKKQ